MVRPYYALIIAFFLAVFFSFALTAKTVNNSPRQDVASTTLSTSPIKDSLVDAADSRGKLLYENHCTTCHDSTVSIRARHKARSLTDVRYWISRWNQHLNLEWSESEIHDVIDYLNQNFYHFPSENTAPD